MILQNAEEDRMKQLSKEIILVRYRQVITINTSIFSSYSVTIGLEITFGVFPSIDFFEKGPVERFMI